MAFSPTKQQELAIDQKGSILVSAAAGSGKTAVLVERVAKMLTDKENKLSADKLLVVTFTNAAAAELRSRIEKRLTEEFEANPNDRFLQEQRMLINSAKICTIDSFCIDFLKENFEQTGLSPTFKIADNSTIDILSKTAIANTINECFENVDPEFSKLLEFLGEDYDDTKLRVCIERIFNFSRHIPYPKQWLERIVSDYKDHTSQGATFWYSAALETVFDILCDAKQTFDNAVKLLATSDIGYEKYSDNFLYYQETCENLMALCAENDWDAVFKTINNLNAPALKTLKKDQKTDEVVIAAKIRDDGKKILAKINDIVYAEKEEIAKETENILPHIVKIVSLVNRYEEILYNLLKKQDFITFYIAEQLVLEMLTNFENGKIVTSKLAEEYVSRFDAILVDEYQDTNTLQDTLFEVLSAGGKNLFCVGDAKQCIYRFRGANPMNFIAKKENAVSFDKRKNISDALRVDLGCNFRSRKEICDYINSVFEKIIYKQNSDFDYDKDEMLDSKATFPDSDELKVETHLLDFDTINETDEEFDEKLEAEAKVVANIVLQTVNKEPFLRQGDGLRKADFGDITILVRSMKKKADFYIKALKEKGIPVSAATSDVLASDEVKTLISLLKVINNPLDDIALATVLTSNIFAFSLSEIADFRAEHRGGRLISALTFAAKNGNEKAKNFLDLISKLRSKSVLMSVSMLIDEIFEETNLINVASLKENGETHRLNLLCLQNLAVSFENERRKDLRSFIKYVSELEESDLGLSVEGKNSVTIMSIHKSKGLQFPVCILANTTNEFNFKDFANPLLINEQFGFSTHYYTDYGTKNDKTILRMIIDQKERRQLLAEELRLLYVALTRAEEKLILVSSFNNLSKSIATKINALEYWPSNDKLNYSLFRKNKSYADWLLETMILNGRAKALLGKEDANDIIIHRDIAKITEVIEEKVKFEPNLEKSAVLKELYEYSYPYKELLDLQSKSSVTEMVHKADSSLYRFTDRPSCMQEKGLRAAEKGTAIHKVMQYANFETCLENLEEELSRLYENLYLTETEFTSVDKDKLKAFFSSSFCKRIMAAESIKKEMRFLAEFPATEIKEDLNKSFSNEMVVVQGAVDLIFEEDGKINILDFKTDRNKDEQALLDAYSEQLKIYAKACEKLFNKPIGDLIIYSFSLEKPILIK